MPVALQAVPDLGGLPVSDAGGRPIGRLVGSLAEAESGLIRYIDLSLDRLVRHVLVPIGHARVRDGENPRVRLRAAVLDDLERIPSWTPGTRALDDDYERDLISAYGLSFYGDEYYAHPAYDHSGLYAGDQPIVRVQEPAPSRAHAARHRLALLSRESDYEIAPGEADIQGWPFMTDADLPSGDVVDLVVDLDEEKVRHVVVEVAGGGGRVLLPVGFLEVDEHGHSVRAPGLRNDDLASLPRYSGDEIAADVEGRACDAIRNRLLDRRRYALPDFRDGRLTDRRRSS